MHAAETADGPVAYRAPTQQVSGQPQLRPSEHHRRFVPRPSGRLITRRQLLAWLEAPLNACSAARACLLFCLPVLLAACTVCGRAAAAAGPT